MPAEFSFFTQESSVSLVDTRADGAYLDHDQPATRIVAYVSVATDNHSEFTDLTLPALRDMRDWCDALLAEIDKPATVHELFIAKGPA